MQPLNQRWLARLLAETNLGQICCDTLGLDDPRRLCESREGHDPSALNGNHSITGKFLEAFGPSPLPGAECAAGDDAPLVFSDRVTGCWQGSIQAASRKLPFKLGQRLRALKSLADT